MQAKAGELDMDVEKEDRFLTRALKIAAYPISGWIGWRFTAPAIRNAAYDNLKETGAFKDIQPAHYEKLNKLTERFMNHEPVDIIHETVKLHEQYKAHLSQRFAEMGLDTTARQWKFIHATQKQNAMMTGFTAAGISIGVLLVVANSKTLDTFGQLLSGQKSNSIAGD